LQLATLFHVAYVAGCVYHNPHTNQPATLADTLDVLHHQRQHVLKHSGPIIGVKSLGLSLGHRHHCKPFLQATGQPVVWAASQQVALQALHSHPNSSLVMWGTKQQTAVSTLAQQANRQVVIIEDGFLRSVGLASEMGRPASLCIDKQGIHFKTSPPSELETLLQNTTFTPQDIQRAKRLRHLICHHELSKYNMQGSNLPSAPLEATPVTPVPRVPQSTPLPHPALRLAKGKKVILAVGQVADDASLLHGSPYLAGNIDLMVEVRRRHPDAFIVFKVHPDVASGNRKGQTELKHIKPLADCVTWKLAMKPWLDACDELHVLTSLSGFEGLLRGKKVVTYGHPFYAGWGLTHDVYPLPQRTRQLTLDELVAGVLIHYPTYFDWQTGLVDTPEHVAWRLAHQLGQSKTWWQTLVFGQVVPLLYRGGRRLFRPKP
jgi:capsular polysaccharide export protein